MKSDDSKLDTSSSTSDSEESVKLNELVPKEHTSHKGDSDDEEVEERRDASNLSLKTEID